MCRGLLSAKTSLLSLVSEPAGWTSVLIFFFFVSMPTHPHHARTINVSIMHQLHMLAFSLGLFHTSMQCLCCFCRMQMEMPKPSQRWICLFPPRGSKFSTQTHRWARGDWSSLCNVSQCINTRERDVWLRHSLCF